MNIHEYQAKAVLREFGVAVPRGLPAFSVEEAVKAADDLDAPVLVVKAQIHAGGRGKAGGVKVVKSKEEVRSEAERLLGAVLVTHQTGPHGKEVRRLYIEEGSAIDQEFYLSALVDREKLAHCLRGIDCGGHGHRRGRPRPSRADYDVCRRSGDRNYAAPRTAGRAGARAQRRSRQAGGKARYSALCRLHRQGYEPARDQPPRRHQRQRARLSRCQDGLR